MEIRPKKVKQIIYECVFKCTDPKILYKFPHDYAACSTWLERLGLNTLPRSFGRSRICNNHFSERMVMRGGPRLTSCAMPDINIPGGVINATSGRNSNIVLPRTVPYSMNYKETSGIEDAAVIITREDSKCFLKCKGAQRTFQFPQFEPSLDVWAKQLGYPYLLRKTSRICKNHFSFRMMASHKCVRLTKCAIPDINLPGTTVFQPDDEYLDDTESEDIDDNPLVVVSTERFEEIIPDSLPNEEDLRTLPDLGSPPIIIEEVPETSRLEIVINPIENIITAINSNPDKEGILHVFQPGVEKSKEDKKEEHVRIALPENVQDADSECVLKCPDGERLFRFPCTEHKRQLWLKQIGLTHCFHNTKICNRHFSEEMYLRSGEKLMKFAYPDINIPKPEQPQIMDASRVLNDFRLIRHNNHMCDLKELPEYICVLTVFKTQNEVGAVVNGIKYVEHKVDENIPKRERGTQVDVADLIKTSSVAIEADDYVDEFKIEPDDEYQELDWIDMLKSNVFTAKVDMYECHICGEISLGSSCNVKHAKVHNESSLLCFQCGRLFRSAHNLKLHEKDKHINKLKKAQRCPKLNCRKAFHSRKQLFHHIDEHSRYEKYPKHKCCRCRRVFSSSLKLHCHQAAFGNCSTTKYSKRIYNRIREKIK